MYRDYKCPECNHIELVGKKYQQDWPEDVKCPECEKKGKEVIMKRQFSVPVISIAAGWDGIVYNAAKFTPMNQIPGVAGITPGVEVEHND